MVKGSRRSSTVSGRPDGAETRNNLLEAAGAVFAESGFDRATAKEIAHRAGANAAAVNYHFGGIEPLYEEVLAEAHRRLVSYQVLARVVSADQDPKDRLRRLIGLLVGVVRSGSSASWPAKVIVREVIAPTPHFEKLRREELEPKKTLIFGVISQIMGVTPDHPLVAQAALSIMAPCFMLLIAEKRLTEVLPPLDRANVSNETLANRLANFVLGGIAQLVATELDG
jgi:TetR/AcrR family transcriptional regulator, regulator of cefoperazone and chloramphenicol sensitivity